MLGFTTTRRISTAFAAVSVLVALAACASVQASPAKADASAATSTSMSMAQEADMRAECKTVHETMMATMADGGMMHEGKMAEGQMMSSAMKSKHMACMELMPELKAEMRANCDAHTAAGMADHMNGMGACGMMQSGADSGGHQP